jgi:Zn-dependent metalloprotease
MFYLSPNSQFVDARDAIEQATIDLYGRGKELIAVQAAFNAVGIQ